MYGSKDTRPICKAGDVPGVVFEPTGYEPTGQHRRGRLIRYAYRAHGRGRVRVR